MTSRFSLPTYAPASVIASSSAGARACVQHTVADQKIECEAGHGAARERNHRLRHEARNEMQHHAEHREVDQRAAGLDADVERRFGRAALHLPAAKREA